MLNEFIKKSWKEARTTAGEGDLPLPYPFVPLSFTKDGMLRTLYYWDTYLRVRMHLKIA